MANPTPRSIVRSLLAQLGAELRGAARSPDDPDAVHDLRVAIRRFHQALRIFPEVFGHGPAKKIRRKLKKLMSALGAVRNLDVAVEVFHASKTEPGARLLHHLREERLSARKHLAHRLTSWRKREVLHGWRALAHGGSGRAQSLARARLELPGLAEAFLGAGNEAASRKIPYHRLHRCRLIGKRLRYTIEMVDGKSSKEFAARMKLLKEMQDHLGGLNDCVTVIELIQGHPAVNKRIRLLLARREKAFHSFWKRKFDIPAQRQWVASFQQETKKG